ncbi:MAG: putative lipid II flippase FtsW [Acidobacteriota bacterium]|jgi:cell division protein FtsW|nr:putative lipid II flippase FtsW [Acidobacteriota bacterium]
MAYKPSSDKILFFTAGFLAIFGLVMVYSASSVKAASEHGMSSYFFLRQLAFAAIGLVLMYGVMKIDYRRWQNPRVLIPFLSLCVVLLLFVLTQPAINGAHRWLHFGSFGFQPSEFAKLAVLMFVAWFLHRYEGEINRFSRRLLPLGLAVGFFAVLIAVEPDLGQALCLCLIVTVLLFVAGLSWRYFVGAAALAIPAFYFFVVKVPYRWDRIQAFRNPFEDPMGTGWQITQSLIAVGSGGVTGLGLGASRQKLFYLPEASSDFLFAVIGEELGIIGTTLVVVAFLIYFLRGVRIALRARDRFGFYLALGITLMVALQALINISMVLALMPTKGIALPFMSQGGSSLWLNMLATGVLLNLSYQNKLAEAPG